jgi:hypothetical protein
LVAPEDLVVPAVWAVLVVPVDLVVPAVWAALAVPENPVVPVRAIGPAVVQALVIAPVVARGRETVQAVAVPELDPEGLPVKIKSAIVAHPHGPVPVLAAEEDLVVAAAETMRAQAATEAAAAWAAAG